jgi:hypothetical protein
MEETASSGSPPPLVPELSGGLENDKNLRDRLESRRSETRERIETYEGRRRLSWAITGVMLVLSSSSAIYTHDFARVLAILLALYSLLPVMWVYLQARPSQWEILDIEEQIDLLQYQHAKPEQRAERLFKHHQYELKKYYDQTLRHSSGIFLLGLLCILFGFATIGITVYVLTSTTLQKSSLSEKLLVASLGAIGSILSNYIASIYLKMFSETIGSLTLFHNRFVTTHHLHYGSFLAAKIEDQELREATLSTMAINTSKGTTADLGEAVTKSRKEMKKG